MEFYKIAIAKTALKVTRYSMCHTWLPTVP